MWVVVVNGGGVHLRSWKLLQAEQTFVCFHLQRLHTRPTLVFAEIDFSNWVFHPRPQFVFAEH